MKTEISDINGETIVSLTITEKERLNLPIIEITTEAPVIDENGPDFRIAESTYTIMLTEQMVLHMYDRLKDK